MFCGSFGFALLNNSLEALDYTVCNKTKCNCLAAMFFIKQLFIINPVNSNSQVRLHDKKKKKKKKMRKMISNYWARTSYLVTRQFLNQCAIDGNVYELREHYHS